MIPISQHVTANSDYRPCLREMKINGNGNLQEYLIIDFIIRIWQDVGSYPKCLLGPGETSWAYYPINKDNNPIMIDENSNIYALRCVRMKLKSFLDCDSAQDEDCHEVCLMYAKFVV